MTTRPDNFDDPLFLASRLLDGELSPEQEKAIEARLRESPELQAELEGLRKADELVRRALGGDVPLDWDAHLAAIRHRLGDPGDSADETLRTATTQEPGAMSDEDQRLDALLAGWAASAPRVDGERFVSEVRRRIRRTVPRQNLVFRVIRLAAPLAAAAAVGIVVFLGIGPMSKRSLLDDATRMVVRIGPASTAGSSDLSETARVVAFHRSSRGPADLRDERVGMTVVSAAEWPDGTMAGQPPI